MVSCRHTQFLLGLPLAGPGHPSRQVTRIGDWDPANRGESEPQIGFRVRGQIASQTHPLAVISRARFFLVEGPKHEDRVAASATTVVMPGGDMSKLGSTAVPATSAFQDPFCAITQQNRYWISSAPVQACEANRGTS